jgi:hypothetical protein
MSHEHRLRFKTLVMVLLMVVCANTGDLMLARGMKQIGNVDISVPGLRHALLSTIQSGSIWIGILFLIGFTLCYMTAVSWADYSFVMPAGAVGDCGAPRAGLAEEMDRGGDDLRRRVAGGADEAEHHE